MSGMEVGLGVVGLGGWGKSVVRAYSQTAGSRIVAICDADARTLAAQSRQYPDATATSQYGQLLENAAIDAVVLATPAPMHYEMARAALRAGKHVYVEKPMTLRADHAEELIELAERQQRKLMVGHLLEYHPAVELMKKEIDAGRLGRVYYMYSQRLNLGVVRQQENAFWSLAPHDISVILYLFGMEPVRIEANGRDFLQRGVDDVVFATLHFPDGRLANIHVSWLDPHKKRSMVVVGSEKMLVFDDMDASEKIRIYDKSAAVPGDGTAPLQAITVRHGDILIPRVDAREPLTLEAQHFVDCVRFDRTPRSDGHDGLRVVRILEEVERQLRGTVPMPVRRAA